MTNDRRTLIVLACGLAVLIIAFGLFSVQPDASAAPPAAPTPVITNYSCDNSKSNVGFYVTQVITVDRGSTEYILADYEVLDLQYVIDQTAGNTVTLKLQHSNNGTNWVDGLTIVSANTADAVDMKQLNNFGWKTRVYADVTNSNPVTITAIGVAK